MRFALEDGMLFRRKFVTVLLVGVCLFTGQVTGFAQLTPANSDAVVAVANNWLELSQEMGWGWTAAADFTPGAIQEIKFEGELLAFSLPVAGGGYVVVPAYRELPPITAYSMNSFYDIGAEDGFCKMLKEVLTYKINLVRSFLMDANPPAEAMVLQEAIEQHRSLWQAYSSDYQTFIKAIEENADGQMDSEEQMEVLHGILDIGPLLGSISWDQGYPYYNDCPWGDGGRCVVGCVATAMTQIMKYWEHPPNGTGSHTYWWDGDQSCGGSTSGQNLSATFSDSYDWPNILDDYSGGETSAQRAAVAELSYEAGVSLEMDYGRCGSGAYTWDVRDALPDYFYYADVIDKEDRDNYGSASAWFDMLQAELNYHRPLQYRIYRHSIVCDGWRYSNQLHFNYGWDDSHNAWYTVDNLYCNWPGCDPMEEYALRYIYPLGSITVTQPNGGETWYVDDWETIEWTSDGLGPSTVTITINFNYPGGAWENIVTGTANDGLHSWQVTQPTTSTARIRVTADYLSSVSDASDGNFTISSVAAEVIIPNGGETWYTGTSENITWSLTGVSGNAKIELNRTYPSGGWEVLYASTPNDGSQSWPVTAPTTSQARIRVSSVSQPGVQDVSDANFTIAEPYITVIEPDGGEVWNENDIETFTWGGAGVTGDVKIELNRDYPSGSWETLYAAVPFINTVQDWTATGPGTENARVKISSVSSPSVYDESDGDFTIIGTGPPVIWHDPLDDGEPGTVTVVASADDDMPGVTMKIFYRLLGAMDYDSAEMNPTGTPDEFSTELILDDGAYEYYLRALDVDMNSAYTDVYDFQLFPFCGETISYDDGSADRYNWAGDTRFRWAVKFTPVSTPFILCGTDFSVSRISPDSAHSRVRIEVYDSDGPSGFPGTLLFSDTSGSIGNVVGGLPPDQTYWANAVIRDGMDEPLVLSGDFYIAVSNTDSGFYEAFSRDTTSVFADRSYLYDGCEEQWYAENDVWENCFDGNRMIRALGYYQGPPTVVVQRSGDDAQLYWSSSGAPYYRVYSDVTPFGGYGTLEGTTSDTTFVDVDAVTDDTKKFYRVLSSTLP